MTPRSERARSFVAYAATDDGATWGFRASMAFGFLLILRAGWHQWFVRDDWAVVINRMVTRDSLGWKQWLLSPQDGHWLTIPVLAFRAIQNTFGLDSYLPFLALVVATHVGAVLLVRVICRRCGVTPWTTTLICAVLLVFGAGWENIIFAIQISYNLSLLAFLAQVLLSDHEGGVDRRDFLGAAIAVLGVMSSGFAPIFVTGIALFLGLRRRWRALAVAVVPQGLVYAWWYVAWESGSTTSVPPGPKSLIPSFVVHGVGSALHSMVAVPGLGGVALIAVIAVALWTGSGWRTQSTLLALSGTAVVMLSAIGVARIGLGVESATASRYQYMTAMLLAPALALAIDQLVKVARQAQWAGRIVIAASIVVNAGILLNSGNDLSRRAQQQRDTFELVAGSGLMDQTLPTQAPDSFSPDVTVQWLPWLVDQHAIRPRVPANQAEIDRVRQAIGLP